MSAKKSHKDQQYILKIKSLLKTYRNSEPDSYLAQYLFNWQEVSLGYAGQWQGRNPLTNQIEFVPNFLAEEELAKTAIIEIEKKYSKLRCVISQDTDEYNVSWLLIRSDGKEVKIESSTSEDLAYSITKTACLVLDYMGYQY